MAVSPGNLASMISVDWKGGEAFEATPPSGNRFSMDGYPEGDQERLGPTPLEAFLSSLAACSAMDVVSILAKKRQVITGYRVEIEGDRPPPDEWPRPYLKIRIRHLLQGENLDPQAVARAVQLSDEKYCSVSATIRQSPDIETTWEIEPSGVPI